MALVGRENGRARIQQAAAAHAQYRHDIRGNEGGTGITRQMSDAHGQADAEIENVVEGKSAVSIVNVKSHSVAGRSGRARDQQSAGRRQTATTVDTL